VITDLRRALSTTTILETFSILRYYYIFFSHRVLRHSLENFLVFVKNKSANCNITKFFSIYFLNLLTAKNAKETRDIGEIITDNFVCIKEESAPKNKMITSYLRFMFYLSIYMKCRGLQFYGFLRLSNVVRRFSFVRLSLRCFLRLLFLLRVGRISIE
jgi:hypothetical protein